jgi:hypothetical protein
MPPKIASLSMIDQALFRKSKSSRARATRQFQIVASFLLDALPTGLAVRKPMIGFAALMAIRQYPVCQICTIAFAATSRGLPASPCGAPAQPRQRDAEELHAN